MSNLVDKEIELQVMTCLDALLDRANHDEYLGRIGKKEALKFLEENRQYVEIIKLRLCRLEAIDNSNPSEALEKLQNLRLYQCGACEHHNCSKCDIYKDFNAVNKYLLKAQEPKHYLKWEDLEFDHEPKYIDVKLGDNKYTLLVGFNIAGYNLAILRTDKQQYYFLEADKQFFNDLRLERVEE